MFPGSIGYQELVVIAAVAVILFGSRLPDVARSLGQSYQQFRKGLTDIQSTLTAEPSASSYQRDEVAADVDHDTIDEPSTGVFQSPPSAEKSDS